MKDWKQADLAEAAGVSELTIRNFEKGKTSLQPASLQVIRAALEAAGVQFVDEGDIAGGKGVVLRGGP